MDVTPNFLIRSVSAKNVNPKRFRVEGRIYYYVTVNIEAGRSSILDDVEMVVYILHPSFGDGRYRVSADRARGFAIDIWTWGFFDVEARLILKQGQKFETISGEVSWSVSTSFSSSW